MQVTVITGGPKLMQCDEDEDFTSAFDKMLSENIQVLMPNDNLKEYIHNKCMMAYETSIKVLVFF